MPVLSRYTAALESVGGGDAVVIVGVSGAGRIDEIGAAKNGGTDTAQYITVSKRVVR